MRAGPSLLSSCLTGTAVLLIYGKTCPSSHFARKARLLHHYLLHRRRFIYVPHGRSSARLLTSCSKDCRPTITAQLWWRRVAAYVSFVCMPPAHELDFVRGCHHGGHAALFAVCAC